MNKNNLINKLEPNLIFYNLNKHLTIIKNEYISIGKRN